MHKLLGNITRSFYIRHTLFLNCQLALESDIFERPMGAWNPYGRPWLGVDSSVESEPDDHSQAGGHHFLDGDVVVWQGPENQHHIPQQCEP